MTISNELKSQWHHSNTRAADDVTSGSTYRARWVCAEGHEWEAVVNSRTRGRGSGCPYCSGRKPVQGVNDLHTTHPALMEEWDEVNKINPKEVSAGSTKKAWWVCANGHTWESAILNRTRGSGCPMCAGSVVITGKTDLATLRPDLSREWVRDNALKPSEVSLGSGKRVRWECGEGHQWDAMVKSRTRGDGCPYCSGLKVIPEENSVGTLRPDLVLEWSTKNSVKPSEVSTGSSKKIWWVCAEGHEWETSVYIRTTGHGCPYCSGRLVDPGTTSISVLRPDLVLEWSTKNARGPEEYSVGSGASVWWRCLKGHEWCSKIANRARFGSKCPYCMNRRINPQENSLRAIRPDLALEWSSRNSIDPDTIPTGSGYKAWWVCENGHVWQACVADRTRLANPSGCPNCVDNRGAENRMVHIMSNTTDPSESFAIDDLRWTSGRKFVVDYLSTGGLVVEYDGGWHKKDKSVEQDLYKTKKLLEAGYRVVRLRQEPLELLDMEHENLQQIPVKWDKEGVDLLRAIGLIRFD